MFPIIPLLAWTGGVAAGAQVASGVVRGVSELVRGRPGAAVLEVTDGCVAPLRMACEQLSALGGDIYTAVLGAGNRVHRAPVPLSRPQRSRARQEQVEQLVSELFNGAPGFCHEPGADA